MKIPSFRLERYLAEHEFKARYLLCASDAETMTIGELLDLEKNAREAFFHLRLGYAESAGSQDLRGEIAKLYQAISPNEVLCMAGAEEGIFLFMNAALEAGDHIIVHTPHYQSLSEIARAIGVQITEWDTCDEKGWELDLVRLKASLRNNTRAIIINCPHNPTGYLMDRDRQQAIFDLARNAGILVFSDEVYRGLEYDEVCRLPAACDRYENAVSLGVMSKSFGLAGLRIGWLCTRVPALLKQMAGLKDYTSICNNSAGEWLAALALRNQAAVLSKTQQLIAENYRVFAAFLERHRDLFQCVLPRAGCIAFPRLLQAVSSDAYCEKLLNETGVLLLPSSAYRYGNSHVRVGFGRKNFPEGLAHWEDSL